MGIFHKDIVDEAADKFLQHCAAPGTIGNVCMSECLERIDEIHRSLNMIQRKLTARGVSNHNEYLNDINNVRNELNKLTVRIR